MLARLRLLGQQLAAAVSLMLTRRRYLLLLRRHLLLLEMMEMELQAALAALFADELALGKRLRIAHSARAHSVFTPKAISRRCATGIRNA